MVVILLVHQQYLRVVCVHPNIASTRICSLRSSHLTELLYCLIALQRPVQTVVCHLLAPGKFGLFLFVVSDIHKQNARFLCFTNP